MREDPCSCPPPLPLCCRLPKQMTPRSLGHKARCVVVWAEAGRRPHFPSSPGRAAPSIRSLRGVLKQLRGSACPQARTPGPLRGWEWGGGRRRLQGFSHIKGGLRRAADARSAYGSSSQAGAGGSRSAPLGTPSPVPSVRRHSGQGGRGSGSWFASLALRLHWSGGAETAAPGPAGGVGRRGPDGGSVCASIGGAGEWGGGAGSGGSGAARGGCINREGGTCILG